MTPSFPRNRVSGLTGAVQADHPSRPDQVLATTSTGVVRLTSKDQTRLPAPAGLAVLDWPTDKLLAGVTAGGAVYRSTDGGRTWEATGQLPGHPEAFTAEPTAWYAATEQGIFTSTDQGSRWTQLL